jgi:hypothetical protein
MGKKRIHKSSLDGVTPEHFNALQAVAEGFGKKRSIRCDFTPEEYDLVRAAAAADDRPMKRWAERTMIAAAREILAYRATLGLRAQVTPVRPAR